MILGFKKEHPPGTPTRFKEKTLTGIKIHSMREDIHDRWQPGNSIQMAYGVRTTNYEQWNEGREDLSVCVSTQKAQIKWKGFDCTLTIDGRQLSQEELEQFAINDGFDDVVQFMAWFNKSKKYKIIHWTSKRY